MKLHSFFAETALFLLVFAAFVFPPLAVSHADGAAFFSAGLLVRCILYCLTALLCLAAVRRIRTGCPAASVFKSRSALISAGNALIAFGALCVCSAVLQLGALFGAYSQGISDVGGLLPASPAEVLLCAAVFFFSAVFEEAVYRAFLPDTLSSIVRNAVLLIRKNPVAAKPPLGRCAGQPATCIFSECAAAALFALAHRYLGVPAVINAAAAHCFLRRCFRRTGSLAPGVIAHFCYNAGSLALLRHLS